MQWICVLIVKMQSHSSPELADVVNVATEVTQTANVKVSLMHYHQHRMQCLTVDTNTPMTSIMILIDGFH